MIRPRPVGPTTYQTYLVRENSTFMLFCGHSAAYDNKIECNRQFSFQVYVEWSFIEFRIHKEAIDTGDSNMCKILLALCIWNSHRLEWEVLHVARQTSFAIINIHL